MSIHRVKTKYSVTLVVVSLSGLLLAQDAAPPRLSDPVLRSSTQEVLIDFVVRDKHRNAITDLKAGDIEVYEDGVKQQLKSFQYRTGKEAVPDAAHKEQQRARALVLDPLREINIVSIVFEGMGPESRRHATQQVQEFLRTEIGTNTWMGVFTLNHRLSAVQGYTTDLDLLRKAVDRAATGAYETFANENLALAIRINQFQAGSDPSAGGRPQASAQYAAQKYHPMSNGSAEDQGPFGGDPVLAGMMAIINQDILKSLFQAEGNRSIDGLRQLVRAQAKLPGRKTVLYISEGLVIPPQQPELLTSVISEANRSNISFYMLDARGLGQVSSSRLASFSASAVNGVIGDGPTVLSATVHTDLQQNARELAEGTGGFSMDNSNDLRSPLRHVMEDIRSHYEATYTPTSTKYDGHFKTLEVRLTRPGLRVQGRKGYYALPQREGKTVAPYELAALNALSATPVPHAFAYHASALRFQQDESGTDCRVVVSVPSKSLKFTVDPAAKTFQIRVSVLALIKDDDGAIVQSIGRDVPFRAPLDRQAEFEKGEVTVSLPARIKPGRYHLETAVLDREAETASVRRSVLTVGAAASVSDIVWVRQVQPHTGERDLSDPLDTAAGKVTPELSPKFTQADTASFYFAVYQGAGAVRISLAKDGHTVATLQPQEPVAEKDGSLVYLQRIPLAGFAPGQYELLVTSKGVAQSRELIEVE